MPPKKKNIKGVCGILTFGFLTAVTALPSGRIAAAPKEISLWNQYGGQSRDFVCAVPAQTTQGAAVIWQRTLGQGTSGIVSDGKTLFTLYSLPVTKNADQGDEVVIALDRTTGKTRWESRIAVKRLKGQESYSNDPIRPQSTPALLQNKLCTLGYTGLLRCFDTETGKIVWEHDLVKEFKATPVQFGFSASPLIYQGAFIVHVGGKQTALIALRPENGAILWKSEAAEPSYASPVLMRVGKEDQIVQVTRDFLLGISATGGETRWKYPLPKQGYTNVPTPIPLSEGRLLVSGQGLLGTRLLRIVPSENLFKVSEVWYNKRVTLFYGNWAADNQAVYGCVNEFVGAISLENGQELWRERGQTDGNLLRFGDKAIITSGDGRLLFCQVTAAKFVVLKELQALKGRCWTPPTLIGDTLFVRDDAEIAAVRLSALTKNKR